MTEAQRAQFFAMRKALDGYVEKIVDNPVEINANLVAIRPWAPGPAVVGDVRMFEGAPYKCVQDHDSTGSPDWTPAATPALWMQYHGTTPETARPWLQPSGAHDQYKAGEYMTLEGVLYLCLSDTTYSPTDYAAAWSAVE